ncbi:MAG TPA: sterol desaturase family protein [Chitinophagales bacterium]|nr:sterol desaturase family protein [Chitinophagales bacterium]HRG28545.1 sterol desaturase family protein [Chitinophagales bacterium]HRG86648.1 sterol desaturase family protein [Chitinophagales bacterium]
MDKYIDIFLQSFSGYWKYLSHEILNPHWGNYFYWLIGISLLVWMLEILFPWRKEQKIIREDFWMDAFYMFFNFFLFSLIGFYAVSNVFVQLFNDFLALFGIKNGIAIEINALPFWLKITFAFILKDFIQWNVHRLLHANKYLWQFHKVHHSVKQMGFAAHLRFHWMENIIYRSIQYIPLAMLGFGINDFILANLIALVIGHFNHANINLPLGPLKYILNNPQMHIWHHAKYIPADKPKGINFGISLSIWDYLFKTDYIPHTGRDIELGWPGDEQFPKDFIHQEIYPVGEGKEGKN